VLKKLYSDYEINHLLVEGGAKTITGFIKQGLVNRLVIIKCPIIIGADGISGVDSLDIDKLTDCKPMSLSLTKFINNDVILVYELM
jgi:diaminohydroxyphosphoribosylaminopyrimidine deaminase/5-amino-6-(5-phosphoribosylamino)uracil reductase